MKYAKTVSFVATIGLGVSVCACSDPVPPTPQGAASIQLTSPTTAGATCPAQHWLNIPANSAVKGPTMSATTVPAKLVDGNGGSTVSCRVRQSGSSFVVEGTLSAADASQGLVRLTATVASGQADGTGTLVVSDVETATQFTTVSDSCVVSVLPESGGEQLGVASGRIWAKLTCTNLYDRSSPGNACDVRQSYVIFENCEQ